MYELRWIYSKYKMHILGKQSAKVQVRQTKFPDRIAHLKKKKKDKKKKKKKPSKSCHCFMKTFPFWYKVTVYSINALFIKAHT